MSVLLACFFRLCVLIQHACTSCCSFEQEAKLLTKDQRKSMLQRHPALAARLFELKQKCLWDCVLGGTNEPLGHILDFWRRIEVTMLCMNTLFKE